MSIITSMDVLPLGGKVFQQKSTSRTFKHGAHTTCLMGLTQSLTTNWNEVVILQ